MFLGSAHSTVIAAIVLARLTVEPVLTIALNVFPAMIAYNMVISTGIDSRVLLSCTNPVAAFILDLDPRSALLANIGLIL